MNLFEAKQLLKKRGYSLIKESRFDSAYNKAMNNVKFAKYIDSISTPADFEENKAKYANYVAELVDDKWWKFTEALEHVISRNWNDYWDEIYNRALDDDFNAKQAKEIADWVATPLSGITYEEKCLDM